MARMSEPVTRNCHYPQLVTLPGVGHVPQFEATEETLEALGAFLKRAPAGSPRL